MKEHCVNGACALEGCYLVKDLQAEQPIVKGLVERAGWTKQKFQKVARESNASAQANGCPETTLVDLLGKRNTAIATEVFNSKQK
jgi:hypothetical protein